MLAGKPELLVEPVGLLPVALLLVGPPWPVVVPQPVALLLVGLQWPVVEPQPVALLLVEPPWPVVEPQPVALPVNSVLAEYHLLKLGT